MDRFRHLIFDLDGTLVDSKADLAAATNVMLAALGLPQLTLDQIAGFVGHGARVLVQKALGETNQHLTEEGFALFMRSYSSHLLDETQVYPGLEALLYEASAQGLCLSVLTNKPEAPSRTILAGLGLAPFFPNIVGGDTLSTKKPDPQGVVYLQSQVGVDLNKTLLIGDSRVDYETGVTAGVAVCGVSWGFGAQDFATLAPQFLVDTPEQLRTVLWM